MSIEDKTVAGAVYAKISPTQWDGVTMAIDTDGNSYQKLP